MGKKMRSNLGMMFKILVGLIYILPIIVAFVYSFHPNSDFAKTGVKLFSDNLTLENYRYVFENVQILSYFKNTFVIVIISIPCSIVITSMAAYAFTFFNFPLRNALFTLYTAGLMIPGEVTFVANYMTVNKLNLINTYAGLCIPYLCGITSMILIRQNMLSVPLELWEAARIDGCTKMKYFFRVMLPLCKPIITAQVITHFIGIYNSYFWPLMVTTRDEWHKVQIGLKHMIQDNGGQFGYVLAGVVISMIIPLALYLSGQKRIVDGMTAGAVKG